MSTSYLAQLDDWVFNDQKTITYSSLSNALQVPADIAKRMLYHFCIERPGKAHSTYCISGLKKSCKSSHRKKTEETKEPQKARSDTGGEEANKENEGAEEVGDNKASTTSGEKTCDSTSSLRLQKCFTLCSAERLEAAKQKFHKLTSVHVYSVSPVPPTERSRSAVLVEADIEQWKRAVADGSAGGASLMRQNSGSRVKNKFVKLADKLGTAAMADTLEPKVQPAIVRSNSQPLSTTSSSKDSKHSGAPPPSKKIKRSSSGPSGSSSSSRLSIGEMFAAADKRAVEASKVRTSSKKNSRPTLSIGELFASRKAAHEAMDAKETNKAQSKKYSTKASTTKRKTKRGIKEPVMTKEKKSRAPRTKRKARTIDSSDSEDEIDLSTLTSQRDTVDKKKPKTAKSTRTRASATNATMAKPASKDIVEIADSGSGSSSEVSGTNVQAESTPSSEGDSRKRNAAGRKKKKSRKKSSLRELHPSEVFQIEQKAKKMQGDGNGPAFDTRTEEDLEAERRERKRLMKARQAAELELEEEAAPKGTIGAMFKQHAKMQGKKHKKARRKRKRLEERTTTTPDGFLLVEKVWVEYSEEEEADNVDAKKALPSTSRANKKQTGDKKKPKSKNAAKKPKKSKKEGQKQPTMLSFFQKKS